MSRSKLCLIAVLIVVSAGAATACTTTTGGTASPSPTGSAVTGTTSADPEVPKVDAAPLDVSKYVGDTCAIVPKDVLSSLRYTDAGEFKAQGDTVFTQAGPSCLWKLRGEGIGLSVALGTGSRDKGAGGLAGIYAGYRQKKFIRFLEPAPEVEGYPAVYFDAQDERSMGSCGLGVGIADDLTFDVYAQGYQGQDDSCAAATQVASSVIKTLKGA
ncbi:DUF3558 domain-containing protein [Amycolatopsis sp. FBCC-B4732]|uniref:DUF3558 domain-containing protein n=1 Tax=Amycolatopsis sp. FBCC-B4732 TaxID=3079339 RepID=UPI001FF4B71A|nr:DUF3558 domain-containing protein [Amycolatopsis sp. FBCC-B4732]UOX91447.1 DUF3558 domain-containing protein [Amycolatopsis sp. FBCC-B4732]